jgi:hypothetical protein
VVVAGRRVLLPSFRQAVEVIIEVEPWRMSRLAVFRLSPQILDDGLRSDLLLDVDGWNIDLERIGFKIGMRVEYRQQSA